MKLYDCVIVGAGFTGLAAAYQLSKEGLQVAVVEKDPHLGGLAGVFSFSNGAELEKFYHHFFLSDSYVLDFISQVGLADSVRIVPSRTGTYYSGQLWRLSSPLDLLRFSALSLVDRVRLGLAVLRARRISDYRDIEHLSIREWLEPQVGQRAFEIVWAPLLESKFGEYADQVSAAWMWKKLLLRGGSRGAAGTEKLAYLDGGFSKLIGRLTLLLAEAGVDFLTNTEVVSLNAIGSEVNSIDTSKGDTLTARSFLLTLPEPEKREILGRLAPETTDSPRAEIPHLANVCLVLGLNRSLSDTYWINVNDPGFPFVGVIEHTNLDDSTNFEGLHIVYLSRYLTVTDPMWRMNDEELLGACIPHLARMFPDFTQEWVEEHSVWRAKYAQPVTVKNYSQLIPSSDTAYSNLFVENMSQVYPEDRGTNYAVRGGLRGARNIIKLLEAIDSGA